MIPMPENIINLNISVIKIGKQFRNDLGDLTELAESIRQGLLQPIGVTSKRELVFGYRRLSACRDVLNWTTIPARIVDVASILDGQIAANTLHKQYTLSERVAIGLDIEARLGGRRGGDHGNQYVGGKCQDFDDCQGRRTDQIAADRSGFGNRQSYRNAKKIVLAARHAPAKYGRLVEYMDRAGKVDGAFRWLRLLQQGETALSKPQPEIPDIAVGGGQNSTIICGDSLVELDRLADESVGLVCTSPPYFNARPEYASYQSYDQYLDFLRTIIRKCHRVLADGRFFVVVIAPVLSPRRSRNEQSIRLPLHLDINPIFVQEGYEFVDDIIWKKPDGAGGQRGKRFAADRNPLAYKPVPVVEYVHVYRKKSSKLIDDLIADVDVETRKASKIADGYERTNIWSISPAKSPIHPAVFPLELAERIVRYYSFVGDVVLDVFAGTGTTGLAARNLGREFCLIEQKREYLLEHLPRFPNALRRGLDGD